MFAGKHRNPVNRTTWKFLRPGKWALYALALGGTFILGRRLGQR
jgi:hypothetical protein